MYSVQSAMMYAIGNISQHFVKYMESIHDFQSQPHGFIKYLTGCSLN